MLALTCRVSVVVAALVVVAAPVAAQLQKTLIVGGFDRPIAFVQDPSSPTRQVVVEQSGRVRVLENGVVQPTDYLSLVGTVLAQGEQGLLGFAFAPDYATSGRVYVSFINVQGHSVISRFLRNASGPPSVNPLSRFDLVWPNGQAYIAQPFANHNGGNIAFGSDGYLYIGLGDGGSGNDPLHHAQNPASLLGKMLRLNVSVDLTDLQGYDVPPGNPFAGNDGVLDEIWAMGLRNPWRWSFDDPAHGGTGALVLGDVGQGQWEEINYEPAGAGGRNYGWRNREGAHAGVTSLPAQPGPLTDPIHEYPHTVGCSVTGGIVYRGSALGPAYYGRYFFADYCQGRIWSLGLNVAANGAASVANVQDHTSSIGTANWSSFGVDAAGEMYVIGYNGGNLFRIVGGATEALGMEFSANGSFSQGMAGWKTFASPELDALDSHLTTSGVLHFRRLPGPANPGSQAAVFQETGAAMAAGTPLTAMFDLGNTSGERKYVKVLLVGDPAFRDLAACAFWIPPHAPMRTFRMRSYTTLPWTNAAIYFYASSTDSDGGFYELDNVSLRYTPGGSIDRTDCVDPLAPGPAIGSDSGNLLDNGGFDTGTLAPWGLFGTVAIRSPIAGGVLELQRPTSAQPAGVVLQVTGDSVPAGEKLTATFQLGNSSAVRQRILLLVHANDFSDLAACTFWLAPGQPLSSHSMTLFAGTAWPNTTFSVYPSTVGPHEWLRLDSVTLRRTPSATAVGTECRKGSEAESFAANAWAANTRAGLKTGSSVAENASVGRGFSPAFPGGTILPAPLDLTSATVAALTFDSRFDSITARAVVEVSTNGIDWIAAGLVAPSDTWQIAEIDLTAFAGEVIQVRFAVYPTDTTETWEIRDVVVHRDGGAGL